MHHLETIVNQPKLAGFYGEINNMEKAIQYTPPPKEKKEKEKEKAAQTPAPKARRKPRRNLKLRKLTISFLPNLSLSKRTQNHTWPNLFRPTPYSSVVPHSLKLAPANNPNVRMPSSMTSSDNVTASGPLHIVTGIPLVTPSPSTNHSQGQPSGPSPQGKEKGLNVKLYFLGDYVRHIHLFGTTDSYSTQLVCECGYQSRAMDIYLCLSAGRTCPSTCATKRMQSSRLARNTPGSKLFVVPNHRKKKMRTRLDVWVNATSFLAQKMPPSICFHLCKPMEILLKRYGHILFHYFLIPDSST